MPRTQAFRCRTFTSRLLVPLLRPHHKDFAVVTPRPARYADDPCSSAEQRPCPSSAGQSLLAAFLQHQVPDFYELSRRARISAGSPQLPSGPSFPSRFLDSVEPRRVLRSQLRAELWSVRNPCPFRPEQSPLTAVLLRQALDFLRASRAGRRISPTLFLLAVPGLGRASSRCLLGRDPGWIRSVHNPCSLRPSRAP